MMLQTVALKSLGFKILCKPLEVIGLRTEALEQLAFTDQVAFGASKMKCPFCQADHDRVIDSRSCEDGFAIRRRRECGQCKRRYTTFERIERANLKVIKKDGTRDVFDRTKLKRGLEKACWKRPVSDAELEHIVSEIENRVLSECDSEVESRYLGELAMQYLRELDHVAYVRFASVYRQFEDAQDFLDELEPILRESNPKISENQPQPGSKIGPHRNLSGNGPPSRF